MHGILDGREVVFFSGNDYLGLSRHPLVIEAAMESLREFGAGAGAAQLISGRTRDHEELEKKLQSFMNAEAVLLFPSGYQANLAAVSALAGEGDLVVMDKLNHASLIDASRMSKAELRVFPHKHYKKLEEILEKYPDKRRKLIVTDAVFSMDGDLADLDAVCAIKKKYHALLVVDEAHAIGVFGLKGSGLVEEKKLWQEVEVRTGTFSKAIGGQGGFIAASREIIDYLVNTARPFIFSTAIAPHLCRAAHRAIGIIESEPPLRKRLLWKTFEVRDEIQKDLGFPMGPSQSPILPLLMGSPEQALAFSQALLEEGVYVPAIRPPAVGPNQSRLRLTLSAAHTDEDFKKLLFAMKTTKSLAIPAGVYPQA